jgi:hypothetical protein
MTDMDGEIRLLTAILLQPVPPCEKFACEFQVQCAKNRMACLPFDLYVQTGAVAKPTTLPSRGRYNKLFPKEVTL